MANGGRTAGSRILVEKIVPSSAGWTEDPSNYNLLIDLPGFKKDEVKIQIGGPGKMTISGEREVHQDKIVCFEKTFTVPGNADLDKTTGKFIGEILYVTVPKQEVEEKITTDENVEEENANGSHIEDEKKGKENANGSNIIEDEKKSKENANHVGCFEEMKKDLKNVKSIANYENVVEMLKRNKGILLTAVIAFSLGVLVARKLKSTRN